MMAGDAHLPWLHCRNQDTQSSLLLWMGAIVGKLSNAESKER